MNYRLIVPTHGKDPMPLLRTLASFVEHVTPAPVDAYLHADGERAAARAYDAIARHDDLCDWTLGGSYDAEGFCASCRECWHEGAAREQRHEHVFWLEHDFVFTRAVDLSVLAAVLDADPELAQMSLMRNACSPAELVAGGLYELHRDWYEPRWATPIVQSGLTPAWLKHRGYFTTTPSLMRRDFMAEHPWPDTDSVPSECEGIFGLELVRQGYSFGVWGSGEPWCEHIGVRTGFGY